MADTPQHLAERLQAEGAKSLAFFKALTRDQWDVTVYTDGARWSIQSLLCHFVGTEVSFQRLIDNILSGGEGAPEDFDLNRYNQRKVADLSGLPLDILFEHFRLARQRTVEIVQALSEKDLERRGRHPFLGVVPLLEIIKMVYLHNQIHLRDLRKLVA